MAAKSLSKLHREYVARIAAELGVAPSYLEVGVDYLHINDYGKRLDSLRLARKAKADKATKSPAKRQSNVVVIENDPTPAFGIAKKIRQDQALRDAYTEHVALAFEDAEFQPLSFGEFVSKLQAKAAAKQRTVKRNSNPAPSSTEYQPVSRRVDYMGRDLRSKKAVLAMDVSDVKQATMALQASRIGFSRGTTFESSKRGTRQKLLVSPTNALRAAKALQAVGMNPRNFERAV